MTKKNPKTTNNKINMKRKQSTTKKSRLRACSLEDKAHIKPQGILGLPEDCRSGLLLSFIPEDESHPN